MSNEQLSRQLPNRVDARKMADQRITLQGSVPIAELKRLDVTTITAGGMLSVSAEFSINESRHRGLRILASGVLTVECQRCLEGYRYPVEVDCEVMLVRNDEIAKIVPKHVEPVVLDEDMIDIWDVLTDEILMILPQVSQHDPAHCKGSASFELGPGEADLGSNTEVENPFSVLAKLKKGN